VRITYKSISIVLAIILLSVNVIGTPTLETTDVSRHLVFVGDGYISHYYVERTNTSNWGHVYLNYTGGLSSIEIATINIKHITIDCHDLYNGHKNEVWITPGSGEYWYKDYIPTNKKYTVHLTSDTLTSITFYKIFLQPSRVFVDGVLTSWSYNGRDIDVWVTGSGYQIVEIYFDERPGIAFRADQQMGIPIVKGWNLLANPFAQDIIITKSMNDCITTIVIKDDDGMFHSVESATIHPHEALYIYSEGKSTLTIVGVEETQRERGLQQGWNLVGLPQQATVSGVKEQGVTIVLYRNDDGMYHVAQDDMVLQQYYGYWIFSNKTRTIEI